MNKTKKRAHKRAQENARARKFKQLKARLANNKLRGERRRAARRRPTMEELMF